MAAGNKHNSLSSKETFELTKHIDGFTAQQFTSWEAAEAYFSHVMGRSVTRHNIKNAITNCGKSQDLILSQNPKSPIHSLAESVRRLEARVKALEDLMK